MTTTLILPVNAEDEKKTGVQPGLIRFCVTGDDVMIERVNEFGAGCKPITTLDAWRAIHAHQQHIIDRLQEATTVMFAVEMRLARGE